MADNIPDDVRDKIATEEDATDLDGLKDFLKSKGHPVVGNWEAGAAAEEAPAAEAAPQQQQQVAQQQMVPQQAMQGMQIPEFTIPASGGGGGITITFKNARIHAEKIIIAKKEK